MADEEVQLRKEMERYQGGSDEEGEEEEGGASGWQRMEMAENGEVSGLVVVSASGWSTVAVAAKFWREKNLSLWMRRQGRQEGK
jgi:hypothetical protein